MTHSHLIGVTGKIAPNISGSVIFTLCVRIGVFKSWKLIKENTRVLVCCHPKTFKSNLAHAFACTPLGQ